uniref:Uncharacterized protein n=1 Tax=Peronospora matthiolae TaxID=2874970 RepID=A0AAV1VFC0_9STRA
MLQAIGDAYTINIRSSLRLHPKFYVGRPKKYRPATLYKLVPSLEAKAQAWTFPPVLLDEPMTSEAAAMQSARFQERGVLFPNPF